MSSVSVRYVCTNCGRSTKENNALEPIKCALCRKVVCHHCSPKGFCETCLVSVPDNGKALLDKVFTQRKIFVAIIWIFLALMAVSIVMVVVGGTEDFIANNPNASTIQNVFGIAGIVLFVGACPITIFSIVVTRKTASVKTKVATITKQHSLQTGIPIPNVGILMDRELFDFNANIHVVLKDGPTKGINEIVMTLGQQGITPDRQDFLDHVRGAVAARFRKTNDPGRAIMAFMVITTYMELLTLVEGRPFSTLNSLPPPIRDFLIAVMRMQNTVNIAMGIVLG